MPSQPQIQICDHRGEGAAERLRALSAAGWHVTVTPSLRASLERLEAAPPDLLVLDPLAGSGAVELEALEARLEPDVPVLVVAGHDSRAAVAGARALSAARRDVVRRDAPFEEWLERIERLAELRALARRASHDDRTGCLRPDAFRQRLHEHFSAAQRHGLPLALAVIDLDRLKRINDEFSHLAGNWVIERVGAALRESLRKEDAAGRLGGDEFEVLLPYTRKLESANVVRRLLDAVRGASGVPPGASRPIRVSASLGFETFDGRDLDSAERLEQHADRAVYVAKRRGGDRGVYYRELPPDER